MNGIILMALTAVAFDGGLEFGWTQLADGRVEYIIQLDDSAMEALKKGESLSSSLPPDLEKIDRIRVQYGTSAVGKPILLRKPGSGLTHPTVQQASVTQPNGGYTNGAQPPPSRFLSPNRSTTIADTRPSMQPGEVTSRNYQGQFYAGEQKSNGDNQVVVSNSTLSTNSPFSNSGMRNDSGMRRTSFVTAPQDNQRGNWESSGRVLSNFDHQSRTNTVNNPNTGTSATTGDPNRTNMQPATNGGFQSNPYNPGSTTNIGNGGGQAPQTGDPRFKNLQPPNTTQPNTTQQGNTFTNNQALSNGNGMTAVRDPNAGIRTTQPFRSRGTGTTGNFQPPANALGNNTFGSTGAAAGFSQNPDYANNYPTRTASNYPFRTIPVTTNNPAPNQEVLALTKQLEELKNQAKEKELQEKLNQMKQDNQKLETKLKDLVDGVEKSKDKKPVAAAAGADKGKTNGKDEEAQGTNMAMGVFLLLSIGFNVFLGLQYYSVSNQFRDLSNDLRDSFMANNYE